MLKTKKIRSEKHLRFVAGLPCLVTGREFDGVQAHHLLRVEGKGMGTKAGDNHTIPLHHTAHDALHRHGKEPEFLAERGIDGVQAAATLYELTGNYDAAYKYIMQNFRHRWGQ